MHLVAYTRRSTDRQDLTHESQFTAIKRARPNDELVVIEDTCSGSIPLAKRDGGAYALTLLRSRRADGIVVAKLDRLTRSLLDGASLIERARSAGWSLIALDLDLDTSTPMGEAMAHVALVFAQFERRRISERTREGLAAKRERDPDWSPGRDAYAHPVRVVARITHERDELGLSLRAIADGLNADGVRTARDAEWHASTVRDVLRRAA